MIRQTGDYQDDDERDDRPLAEMYAAGNWIMIPKDFALIMPLDEAYFLAYLCNMAFVAMAQERYDGWFYRKGPQIQRDLNLNSYKQGLLVKKLKAKGYLDTEMRGLPAKRYFHIDYETVRKDAITARKRLK